MTTEKKLSDYVSDVLRANVGHLRIRQTALAAASGLSQPTVSRILSGDRELRLDELSMMCDGLGFEFADVLAEANRLKRIGDNAPPRIITG